MLVENIKRRVRESMDKKIQEMRQTLRQGYTEQRSATVNEAEKIVGQSQQTASNDYFSRSATTTKTPEITVKPTVVKFDPQNPTLSSTLAQMYNVSGGKTNLNEEKWNELYQMFESEAINPSSPIYSPYLFATSSNPTQAQEATTQKLEQEWLSLQNTLSYWASRDDLNLSDDEILSKIDWNDYSTLNTARKNAALGNPTKTTRPIGFADDAMYGVIWAARNGGSTGNTLADTIAWAIGDGASYVRDENIHAMLDPTNESYNPYSVGCTFDDAASYFGVSSFGKDWVIKNRNLLNGTETEKEMYKKVYSAEQTTLEAEAEIEELKARIDEKLLYTSDPEEVLESVFDIDNDDKNSPLSTLKKINESLKSGDILNLTRPIDYSYSQIQQYVEEQCAKKIDAAQRDEVVGEIVKALSNGVSISAIDSAINSQRDNRIYENSVVFRRLGTESEKLTFQSAYPSNQESNILQIRNSILNGTASRETLYNYSIQKANKLAAENYLDAIKTIDEFQSSVAGPAKDFDSMGYQERLHSIAESQDTTGKMKYAKALENLKKIEQAYSFAAKIGGMSPDVDSGLFSVVDYLYQYGKEYIPKQWQSYSAYQMMLDAGYTEESVVDAAALTIENNQKEIQTIDYVIEQARKNNISGSEQYIKNLEKRKESLQDSIIDAGFFSLKYTDPNFEQIVSEYREKVNEAWDGKTFLSKFGSRNGISYTDYKIAGGKLTSADNQYMMEMTDDERDTYLYLSATQGHDIAMEYYNRLEENTLTVRRSEYYNSVVNEIAQSGPVGSIALTLGTIALSPVQIAGTAYSVYKGIVGEEINPYSKYFESNRFVSGGREAVKSQIESDLQGNSTALFFANLGYDAVTSAGDSLVSGVVGGSALASISLMAGEAASNTVMDAKLRGASNTQALILGGVSFATEAGTEALPINKMIEAFQSGSSSTIKSLAKQVLESSLEEAPGEMISEIITSISDDLIMQELSNKNKIVLQYIEEGKSEKEAENLANKEILKNVIMAGVTGAVSGGLSTGVAGVTGKILNRTANTIAAETAEDTAAEIDSDVFPQNTDTAENIAVENHAKNANAQESGSIENSSTENAKHENVQQENTQQENAQENAEEQAQNPDDTKTSKFSERTDKNAENLRRAAAALTTALSQNDTANKEATIAAAISSVGIDDAIASAAAKKLISGIGGDNAVLAMLQTVMSSIEGEGVAKESVSAIVISALSPTEQSQTQLQNLASGEFTQENMSALIENAKEKMNDPAMLSQIRTEVTEDKISNTVKSMVADGAFNALDPYRKSVAQAKENVRYAKENLNRAVSEKQTSSENLKAIRSQYLENVNDPAVAAMFQQAAKDLIGKTKVVEQMRQSVEKNVSQLKNARIELQTLEKNLLTQIREQAREAVAQQAQQSAVYFGQETFFPAESNQQPAAETQIEPAVDMAQNSEQKGVQQPEETSKGQIVRTLKVSGNNANSAQSTAQENAQPAKANKKIKNPVQIASDLMKEIGVANYVGSRKTFDPSTSRPVPSSVRGYYESRANYIGIRSANASDFNTSMHEIGHAIQSIVGMKATNEMVESLPDVFKEAYSLKELPNEAFAEFVKNYLVGGNNAAREFAGNEFVDSFDKALLKNGIYKQFMNAKNDISAFMNASVANQIDSLMVDRSQKKKSTWKDRFRNIVASFVDDTSAAEEINEIIRKNTKNKTIPLQMDVRANALLRNFSSRQAVANLTETLTAPNGAIIGEGLATRFEKAGLSGKDARNFNLYLLALHSMDRDVQNKAVFGEFFTPESRRNFIDEMNAEHPEFSKAAEAFQSFRKEFLQAYLVDTGYLPQEVFDMLNQMYPNYVPTQRLKETVQGKSKSGGKNFTIKEAKGSEEQIFVPIDTFAQMVDSIVTMVKSNDVALAFDNAYQAYDGLGMFAREVPQDMRKDTVNTEGLQNEVKKILTENNTSDDVLQSVIDMIGKEQSQWKGTGDVRGNNIVSVQRPDGKKVFYEVLDTPLYRLLAFQRDYGKNLLSFVGKTTNVMARLTTGSNPFFLVKNFARDFQNGINYGSWATTYADGAVKWLRAAWDVFKNKGEYADYKALGGGGWTRVATGSKAGTETVRNMLYKGYDSDTVTKKAGKAASIAWKTITADRLNEVVEQTSRYAEYKFGKYDKSTQEGKQRAFLGAQDVTVDFARRGYGEISQDVKQLIPFFGASLQGMYRTARMFTGTERGQLAKRFAKTVVNVGITSALSNALLIKFFDKPEEKEEYARMSDDLKASHIYLPNFLPEVFGNAPLIRIPLPQDPLSYALHGVITDCMWYGTTEDPVVELSAIVGQVVDNLNPISDPVFSPILQSISNKTYYGSNIVPDYMSGWAESTKYTNETPGIFVTLGRLTNVSPMKIEYLFKQYTGFLGQTVIPFLSKDENTGEIGGINAVISAGRKMFTSDPLTSNNVISSMYDGIDSLTEVINAYKNEKPLNMLRRGLTEEQYKTAYQEAYDLTHSGGIIYEAKSQISDLYSQIDSINANEALTESDKYTLTSDLRRQQIELALTANEAYGEYKEKYLNGKSIFNTLMEGAVVQQPTAYEMLDNAFLNDEDKEYMQLAKSVWDSSGDDSTLPHPNYSFKSDKVDYTVGESDKQAYTNEYKKAYEQYILENTSNWDALTEDEKIDIMKKAHTKAHTASKNWSKEKYKIK